MFLTYIKTLLLFFLPEFTGFSVSQLDSYVHLSSLFFIFKLAISFSNLTSPRSVYTVIFFLFVSTIYRHFFNLNISQIVPIESIEFIIIVLARSYYYPTQSICCIFYYNLLLLLQVSLVALCQLSSSKTFNFQNSFNFFSSLNIIIVI